MGIRLGVNEYERPTRPIKADDIRQILAVGGKDVIRIAWPSLNPNSRSDVKFDTLAVWYCASGKGTSRFPHRGWVEESMNQGGRP